VAKFRGPNDANYEKVENAIRELCKIRRSRRDRKWAQIAGSHSRETAHRTLNFRIPSQLPSKSTHFTGRESELEWMEQTLLRTCLPNCPSNCHTINLYGIAGIGKTQIALEFAYRFRDDFSSIFWIPSHTQIAVENAFLDIAHTLRLTDSTTKDENSTREIPQLVMEWLMNGRNSNWLLIFDDADFAAAPNLKPLIPTTTCVHGNAIITSRSPIKLPFTKPYHVEGLELEEARAFFKTGLGLPSTDGQLTLSVLRILLIRSRLRTRQFVRFSRPEPICTIDGMRIHAQYPFVTQAISGYLRVYRYWPINEICFEDHGKHFCSIHQKHL